MGRKGYFLSALALLTILSAAGPAAAKWSDPIRVGPDTSIVMDVDVTEGPGEVLHYVYAAYAGGGSGIYYTRSADRGATWTAPVLIVQTTYWWTRINHPSVAVGPDGVVHMACEYMNWFGYAEMEYFRSVDDGRTWECRYSWGSNFAEMATVSVDPVGRTYLTWGKNYVAPIYVLFNRSDDGGVTWGPYRKVVDGWIVQGYELAWAGESRSHLLDDSGRLHVLSSMEYGVSDDLGDTWREVNSIPADFAPRGIYGNGSEILVAGSRGANPAFLRSRDGGNSWESPGIISPMSGWITQVVAEPDGHYYTLMQTGPGRGEHFFRSSDFGQTWSEPEYLGSGRYLKLIKTSWGDLFSTYCEVYAGLVKYQEPAGVDAPGYLSLWEKSDFLYTFRAFGTGTIQVDFPADAVGVSPDVSVNVGSETVAGTVTLEGDRVVVRFPAALSAWTDISLPISVLKGNKGRREALVSALQGKSEAMGAVLQASFAEEASRIDSDIQVLAKELSSRSWEFGISLLGDSGILAVDRTQVLIYDKVTSVFAHFKAQPPQDPGARLVMLSDQSVQASPGEPLRLEVKVTHLTEGQVADVSIRGAFQVIQAVEKAEDGARTETFYFFYPPDFANDTDIITIDVAVNGVVAGTEYTVNLP